MKKLAAWQVRSRFFPHQRPSVTTHSGWQLVRAGEGDSWRSGHLFKAERGLHDTTTNGLMVEYGEANGSERVVSCRQFAVLAGCRVVEDFICMECADRADGVSGTFATGGRANVWVCVAKCVRSE